MQGVKPPSRFIALFCILQRCRLSESYSPHFHCSPSANLTYSCVLPCFFLFCFVFLPKPGSSPSWSKIYLGGTSNLSDHSQRTAVGVQKNVRFFFVFFLLYRQKLSKGTQTRVIIIPTKLLKTPLLHFCLLHSFPWSYPIICVYILVFLTSREPQQPFTVM